MRFWSKVWPMRPMLLANTNKPFRYPIEITSAISWGVNLEGSKVSNK